MSLHHNHGQLAQYPRIVPGPSVCVSRSTNGEHWWRLMIWVILVIGAVVMAFPFVWLVSSSLKLENDIFIFPPQWIPNPVRFAELL